MNEPTSVNWGTVLVIVLVLVVVAVIGYLLFTFFTRPQSPSGASWVAEVDQNDVDTLRDQLAEKRKMVERSSRELARVTNASARQLGFAATRQLHSESVRIADSWYHEYRSAKNSLRSIAKGLESMKKQQGSLYRLRSRSRGRRRAVVHREFESLQATVRSVSTAKAQVAAEVDRGLTMVREQNKRTHDLKMVIRDSFGDQGLVWYNRKQLK